jgi:hypothetical protein
MPLIALPFTVDSVGHELDDAGCAKSGLTPLSPHLQPQWTLGF